MHSRTEFAAGVDSNIFHNMLYVVGILCGNLHSSATIRRQRLYGHLC